MLRFVLICQAVLICTIVPALAQAKAFDKSKEHYAGTYLLNCKVIEVKNDTITVYDSDTKSVHSHVFVDFLTKGKLDKWCGQSTAYIPSQLQAGDEVALSADRHNGTYFISKISIEKRPSGSVPPSMLKGFNGIHYNDTRNFYLLLKEGEVPTRGLCEQYGYNEAILRQNGFNKHADAIYGESTQKLGKDQAKKVATNTEVGTLKAPSATAPKDKPPTEKK